MKALMSFVLFGAVAVFTISCEKKLEDSSSSQRFLFVASGQCYSGNGITTFTNTTSSNLIFKVNLETGVRDSIIADYYASPAGAGDTPSSIVDWDGTNLMVYVRNLATGRLETVSKTGGVRNNFGTSPAASSFLNTNPKSMQKSSDGGLLLARTGFLEKVNASGIRNASVFVNSNLGATCGTANTLYTDIAVSTTGRVITANAAASPNNRLISVPAAGAASSCDAGLAAPATTTFATAMAFDAAHGKLIVAYAGSALTANINSIHVYDFNETNGAITNDQVIYDASAYPATYNYLLFGISAMALDPETSTLYVATAISTAATVVNYAIEKLNYNASAIGTANSTVLTRSGTLPFYNYGVDTKCISSLLVGKTTPPAQ